MSKVKLITDRLIDNLQQEVQSSDIIYILTSFVMKSGVELIKPLLEDAIERGAEIKLCAGDYLYITQPDALETLNTIIGVEVRLWRSRGKSFHPKAYLFGQSNDQNEGSFIIGSSNLSASALTNGVEWNLYMNKAVEPLSYQEAMDMYLKTFYHEETIPVNAETIKKYREKYEKFHAAHNIAKKWTEQEETELMYSSDPKSDEVNDEPTAYEVEISNEEEITPRPAQKDALIALETTYEENYSKSMVVMATGLGKTYLAGFLRGILIGYCL